MKKESQLESYCYTKWKRKNGLDMDKGSDVRLEKRA